MCGIFGMILQDRNKVDFRSFEDSIRLLFSLSKERGQDAVGMATYSNDTIEIFRRVIKPLEYLKLSGFTDALRSAYDKQGKPPLIVVGQCRLATNGSFAVCENNQPVWQGHLVGVHNGIVTNADVLNENSNQSPHIEKPPSLTTEGIFALNDTRLFFARIDTVYREIGDLSSAVSKVFNEAEGSASVAVMSDVDSRLVIASNTGSLYFVIDSHSGNVVFMSERRMLRSFLLQSYIFDKALLPNIVQVAPGTGVEFKDASVMTFTFKERKKLKQISHSVQRFGVRDIKSSLSNLKRCSRCILPHTYPFISFDEMGVCNFCNRYAHQKFYGSARLEQILDRYRSPDGSPDCLVGLSGGRDSCYGLHVLKVEYGMHPIAYTYDWGLTTDTSRRNQARVCGKLGIEQIIRAPDIQKKRRNIRANIYAWLKNPQLGMIPLFMAGDKDFYHFGRQLRKELDIKLTIFCSGYLLEQREFFVGFCGVNENVTTTARLYKYSNIAKLKLALYYSMQYLKNPAYINESFLDSIRSFFTSFLGKDDFLYLYEYLPWEQKRIEEVIRQEFGWEDYKAYGANQWRMGDGQTAFTNYIYYSIAGFSEFDNFRANQIREGLLTRDEALNLVELDNKPKYEALQYFSYVVGFNLDEVLAMIDSLPKMY